MVWASPPSPPLATRYTYTNTHILSHTHSLSHTLSFFLSFFLDCFLDCFLAFFNIFLFLCFLFFRQRIRMVATMQGLITTSWYGVECTVCIALTVSYCVFPFVFMYYIFSLSPSLSLSLSPRTGAEDGIATPFLVIARTHHVGDGLQRLLQRLPQKMRGRGREGEGDVKIIGLSIGSTTNQRS